MEDGIQDTRPTSVSSAWRRSMRPSGQTLASGGLRERLAHRLFLGLTVLPLVLVLVILLALIARARPILCTAPASELLRGITWLPTDGKFGYYPFIMGTLWVTIVAMFLAIPPSPLTAIYLAEYAGSPIRALTKPLLDVLAGIPSVVFGVWGLVAIVPWVRAFLAPTLGRWLGFLPYSPQTTLRSTA